MPVIPLPHQIYALKAEFSTRGFYDVWLPELAPSEELLKLGQAADDAVRWRTFERRYRAEMKESGPAHVLNLFAAL